MSKRSTTILVLGVLLALLSMVSMAAGRVWVPLSDWLNPGERHGTPAMTLQLDPRAGLQ